MIQLLPKVVRNLLLRISDTEVSFARRGFEPSSLQTHLEEIGRSFLFGYHLALDDASAFSHGSSIANGDPIYQGFVFEGAAMAFAITDSLALRKRNQWQQFLDGVGAPHRYVVHVGLGWAYARIPWYRRNPEKYMDRFDPLLKWLVLDGYGFHEIPGMIYCIHSVRRLIFRGQAVLALHRSLACLWAHTILEGSSASKTQVPPTPFCNALTQ